MAIASLTRPRADEEPVAPRAGGPEVRPAPAPRSARPMAGWLEAHALAVAAWAAVVVVALLSLPSHLSQDGWLALVSGRWIAAHGVPHTDLFTVMAHGSPWIDQQWLAQLASYGLYAAGGLALYTLGHVLLISIAFAAALAAARALGGSERHLTAVLPIACFFFIATAITVRTQGFAFPLFAITLFLLAADVRRPSRRVLLTLPILALWANLHGSVTMGAGLVMLLGATRVVATARSGGVHAALADRRSLALVGLAPLTLFATPYGTDVVGYYATTLFNPAFGKLVTEWRPITSIMLLAVPFFVLALAATWLLGRGSRRIPVFDQATLLILAFGAILAVRNVAWFGLAALMLLPASAGAALAPRPPKPRRTRINQVLAVGSLAAVALSVLGTLVRPAGWFERTYDMRGLAAVTRFAADHPRALIYADVHFADWFLWHEPQLAGRIAFDARFELLSAKQLQATADVGQPRLAGEPDLLGPFSLLVLDGKEHRAGRLMLARPGAVTAFRDARMLLVAQPPRATAGDLLQPR